MIITNTERYEALYSIDSKGLYQFKSGTRSISIFRTPNDIPHTVYTVIISDIKNKFFYREDGLTIDECLLIGHTK